MLTTADVRHSLIERIAELLGDHTGPVGPREEALVQLATAYALLAGLDEPADA
ncbi:MAG: hypothetical protein ACKVWR_22795 [Acidimicrobiales bacterium]